MLLWRVTWFCTEYSVLNIYVTLFFFGLSCLIDLSVYLQSRRLCCGHFAIINTPEKSWIIFQPVTDFLLPRHYVINWDIFNKILIQQTDLTCFLKLFFSWWDQNTTFWRLLPFRIWISHSLTQIFDKASNTLRLWSPFSLEYS